MLGLPVPFPEFLQMCSNILLSDTSTHQRTFQFQCLGESLGCSTSLRTEAHRQTFCWCSPPPPFFPFHLIEPCCGCSMIGESYIPHSGDNMGWYSLAGAHRLLWVERWVGPNSVFLFGLFLWVSVPRKTACPLLRTLFLCPSPSSRFRKGVAPLNCSLPSVPCPHIS